MANKKFSFSPYFDAMHILLFFALAIVAFLPYLIVFAPGIIEIDTVFQIGMFEGYGFGTMGEGTFTKLFPLMCSVVFGGLFDLGRMITGTQSGGIMFMTSIQMLGVAFAGAFSCCYLSKWSVPAWGRWVAFALFVLLPVVPLMAIDVGKDSLFIVFYLPFCVCLAETLRTFIHDESMSLVWSLAGTVFAVGAALATSKGALVVLVSIVLMIVVVRKNKRSVMASAIMLSSVLVVTVVISLIIAPSITINDKISVREVLSTPIQQVTYALKSGAEITDEEREKLGNFYDYKAAIQDFNPRITDNTKVKMDLHASDAQIKDFVSAYLSIGVRNPGMYIQSFVDLLYTFWTPGEYNSTIMQRFLPNYLHESRFAEYGITRADGTDLPNNFSQMKELINSDMVLYSANRLPEYAKNHPDFGDWELNPSYNPIRKAVFCSIIDLAQIPIIGLLVQKPTYALFLPIVMLIAVITFARGKRVQTLVLLMPLLLSVVFVFASPCDFSRYVYPCMAACFLYVPIIIVKCISSVRREMASIH